MAAPEYVIPVKTDDLDPRYFLTLLITSNVFKVKSSIFRAKIIVEQTTRVLNKYLHHFLKRVIDLLVKYLKYVFASK